MLSTARMEHGETMRLAPRAIRVILAFEVGRTTPLPGHLNGGFVRRLVRCLRDARSNGVQDRIASAWCAGVAPDIDSHDDDWPSVARVCAHLARELGRAIDAGRALVVIRFHHTNVFTVHGLRDYLQAITSAGERLGVRVEFPTSIEEVINELSALK